jgi:predicted fused transcriptional regulator/phosphomethylpyrimidine kinase
MEGYLHILRKVLGLFVDLPQVRSCYGIRYKEQINRMKHNTSREVSSSRYDEEFHRIT